MNWLSCSTNLSVRNIFLTPNNLTSFCLHRLQFRFSLARARLFNKVLQKKLKKKIVKSQQMSGISVSSAIGSELDEQAVMLDEFGGKNYFFNTKHFA